MLEMVERRSDKSTNLIIVMFVIFAFILSDILLLSSIESQKRVQARYNLEQIKYCYNELYPFYPDDRILDICTSKSKASYTGDVYVLEYKTMKFIYENSTDVPKEELYFTEDSVGKYFTEWSSTEEVLGYFMLGKDSISGLDVSYRFDSDEEWIEWKFLPSDGTYHKRLIVVQGVQRDEVLSYYKYYRMFGLVMVVILIMSLLTMNVAHKRRKRTCDAINEPR